MPRISNDYLDLAPVERTAADLGLAAMVPARLRWRSTGASPARIELDCDARDPGARGSGGRIGAARSPPSAWDDDYSNILRAKMGLPNGDDGP
jgi:hypothetical protein